MKIHNVEQRSDEWYALRLGVPTASEYDKAVTPKKGELSTQSTKFAGKLAYEIFTGETCGDFFQSEWMERGKELEDEARAQYGLVYDVDVREVGFITDDKGRGCSPDGLIGDDGMIVIKCLKPDGYMAALLKWEQDRQIDDKYIPQVMGQMLVAGRAWCDLVFYCPKCPLVAAKIEPNEKYMATLDAALDSIMQTRDYALSLLKGE